MTQPKSPSARLGPVGPLPLVARLAWISALFLSSQWLAASRAGGQIIPPDRLPPGGLFHAGVPGGIPSNAPVFCNVAAKIPGSALLADPTGNVDSAPAINAALSECPANEVVLVPAGTYRIDSTLSFPSKKGVILRGAGSQTDPLQTTLLCYTGTAVQMKGSSSSTQGWFDSILGGYTTGSQSLTFAGSAGISGIAAGDVLVVLERYDPSLGVTVGGALESIPFPPASYSWRASAKAKGSYYVVASGGGSPLLTQAELQQVFYSPKAGSESILMPAAGVSSLAAGQWAYGNADALGFNTLYVKLPGNVNPANLPPPGTDGVPDGGVWYSSGIAWGGECQAPSSNGGVYVHHGQGFIVTSKSGGTVKLDRPFYWNFTGQLIGAVAYNLVAGMGLEDMNIQVMQGSPALDTVIMSDVKDSWIRNVAVKNSAHNFIVASNTIDCEIDHNYVTNPWNAQGGSGYGIRLLGWNFNDLVQDNIAYFCRHSYVQDGINTGNIIAYNFSLDPNDIANYPATPLPTPSANPHGNDGYLYQDFLTHGSNPRFSLYEGNVGGRAYCDFCHGSANNLVFFRNHFRLQEDAILDYIFYKGSATVDFDRWNDSMTVVGNILGYPAMQMDQKSCSKHSMTYEGHTQAIYRLGYDADDSATVMSDTQPDATILRTGNYDYVTQAIQWSSANHSIPNSLYLAAKPSWFGATAWPPVDPAHPALAEEPSGIIPAMTRFLIMEFGN